MNEEGPDPSGDPQGVSSAKEIQLRDGLAAKRSRGVAGAADGAVRLCKDDGVKRRADKNINAPGGAVRKLTNSKVWFRLTKEILGGDVRPKYFVEREENQTQM